MLKVHLQHFFLSLILLITYPRILHTSSSVLYFIILKNFSKIIQFIVERRRSVTIEMRVISAFFEDRKRMDAMES